MSFLEIRDLTAGYGHDAPVLCGFSLSLEEGEFIALLGPSGCGKTTALRTVLGFVRPRAGSIVLKGRDVTGVPPHRRNFGVVYQSYALFPHLNVFDNIAFGLKMRPVHRREIPDRVSRWLALVGLEEFAKRLPMQLSGGQRQRVALARALAVEPTLLLLDEPLSNLDAKLREEMRVELRRIQQELGTTAIYVTHDQLEALSMSDRVALLNRGVIEQADAPDTLYRNPATPFVAHFMGYTNKLEGLVDTFQEGVVTVEAGSLRLQTRWLGSEEPKAGDAVQLLFRSEAAVLEDAPPEVNAIPGDIRFASFQGHTVRYLVSTLLGEIDVTVPEGAGRKAIGRSIYVSVSTGDLIAYHAAEELESGSEEEAE
jgi:putative spermidine/putrescine transport system ATP-binding protein